MSIGNSFFKQGKEDLIRSEKLFCDGDIAGSVFSAQQGLEKHLKAFLLNAQVFPEPRKLGHLGFPAILGKMIAIIEEIKTLDTQYEVVNKYFDSISEYFQNQKEIIDKIARDQPLQILFWKISLGIKPNGNDIRLVKEVLDSFGKHSEKCRSSLQNVFQYFMVNSTHQSKIWMDPITEQKKLNFQ